MIVQENTMDGQETLTLFKGWFHNKMTVILLMSQYPGLRKGSRDVSRQLFFLHDLEHHYVRISKSAADFSQAVRWLRAFFRIYPMRVTPARSQKALQQVRIIYDAFGFTLFWNNKVIQK